MVSWIRKRFLSWFGYVSLMCFLMWIWIWIFKMFSSNLIGGLRI